jgi:hypothetical protein
MSWPTRFATAIETTVQDLRDALRTMRHNPGFTALPVNSLVVAHRRRLRPKW